MVKIDGHHLTISEVINVARFYEKVSISDQGIRNITHSHSIKETIIKTGKPVYGINTGFGIFSDKRIADNDSAKLSRNLILSHAVGTGTHWKMRLCVPPCLLELIRSQKDFLESV